MKIANPSNLPTIDYRLVKPLQGDLKDLSEANYHKLRHVLTKRGFTAPLFLWKHEDSYYLMDGHQRQRVMIKEDMQPYEVPYVLIEARDEQDAKQQLLELTSQYGRITQEGFDEFMVDLPEAEVTMSVNFDALPLLTRVDDEEIEEDEAPEVDDTTEPESKYGTVYQLGRHRLMCGDATKEHDVATLMNGATADMVFTDPPYGIDEETDRVFASRTRLAKGNKFSKIIGDTSTDVAIQVYQNLKDSAPKQVWWGANYYAHSLPESGNWLVWDKRVDDKERDFNSDCELAWVKSKRNSVRIFRHKWKGMIKASEHGEGRVHPTQKPIALAAWAFDEYDAGNTVLDVFGGSGSTLIAAEQTDRSCYMMELDPKYVDVIRKRYAKLVHGADADWVQITPAIT